MRRNQSSSSSSSSKSQRIGKKQKRLDAICEKEYNRNRFVEVEPSGCGILEDEAIRRSSRVRRAPVVLDMSPSPVKKRRKGVDSGRVSVSSKNEGGKGEEGGGSWKSRLRSTVHSGSLGLKEKFDSEGIKRKLSDEWEEMEENEVAKLPKAKLNRKGSGKDRVLGSQKKMDKNDRDLEDGAMPLDEEDNVVMGDKCDRDIVDGSSVQLGEKEEIKVSDEVPVSDEQNGSRHLETLDQCDKCVSQAECEKEGEDCTVSMNAVGNSSDKLHNRGSTIGKADCSAAFDEKHKEDMNADADKSKQFSAGMLDKKHTRQGRRCGLCGRGTDGKPPKRLAADPTDSDNEAYGGSSSCEEGNYDILDGFGDEPGWLGRLLGPIHDRFGIADVWVHQHCAVWSPEVYFAGLGCLKNVRAALFRGKLLKCSRCGRSGATIGCRVDRCPRNYHLPCGRANGCIFDHRKFLIACNDHRHLFEPHSNNKLQRLKKLKAKKLKLETRKLSHDAWRKDFEAEEKWLENCGEDEEFLKREGKRLHRDILRIAPVYIGASSTENEKQYQGWESVAGLQDVIQCMKEVVLLPLLYPEFFTNIGLTAPRGVLLHGYPGTGKTHVVRALIGSCARGDRRIAYFARKGADCLGKYVGDAERQLRLLFQVAERSQPSIIFFDEIDGLAPCRTRQQDQTHNSVVSTLLALMDGLKSRGSVIVIGATNRPDAVDPALRRPGRFDREIYFPLPSVKDRAAILSLHTRSWSKPISGSLLKWIAQRTSGFAGADLQALCTQAAMIALKRNCPLHELMSAAEKEANSGRHLPLPSCFVEEIDWLDALACAPPPCSRREAGMAANDVVSSPLQAHLVPCLLQPLSYLLVSLYLDERVWLPPFLYKAAKLIKTIIISALDHREKSSDIWWSYLPDLVKEADVARQIEEKLSSAGLLISGSSFVNYTALPDNYADDAGSEFELCKVSSDGACATMFQNISCSSRKSGFRVLITGHPKSGQRHLASCLLHGFVGCVEIQKVDLATISQEGHGDLIEGMTNILLKCSSKGLCVIYMPRIDLWAMEETQDQVDEKEDDSCAGMFESADTAGSCDAKLSASRVWNAFMEQVESICLSASLMILATSEVPSEDIPHRISQFFTSNALSLNDSTISEHTLPRFVVQVGGCFDFDMVINSCAIQLSRDLVQEYVQLVHRRTHAAVKRDDNRTGGVMLSSAEVKNDNILSGTASEGAEDVISLRTTSNGFDSFHINKIQRNVHGDDQSPTILKATDHKEADVNVCKDTVPKVLCNNRTVKGKSTLLLAISSFGYQILRYPHFAELCWTTSKLKEGPCADINGPWKGWPFNSCIIRPGDSLEKVPLGKSSSNLKTKESFGVVRGLIAVGLLAYNGVYKSIREVSFEVRKVLELLVEQLNAKILAGKKRSRFLYLLSQVAYLEDVVNSWAYTLQSLECDSSISATNHGATSAHYPDDYPTSERNAVGSDVCKTNNPQKISDEVEVQGQCEFIGSTTSKQGLHEMTSSVQPSHGSFHQVSTSSVNKLAKGNSLNTKEANAVEPENSKSTNSSYKKVGDEYKYMSMKKMALPSKSHKSDGLAENSNIILNKGGVVSLTSVSRLTCLYSCCFNCIDLVYILIRKMLICEWKTIGSSWTVEDAHDAVCSWSTHLLSAVRKLYAVESLGKSEVSSKNSSHETDARLCTCSDVDNRRPNRNTYNTSSGNKVVVPMECSSHSKSQNVTGITNASTKSQIGLGFKFSFKDNVLISSDLDNDVLFHCKFQNLCLNSLIEWILMIKQPELM